MRIMQPPLHRVPPQAWQGTHALPASAGPQANPREDCRRAPVCLPARHTASRGHAEPSSPRRRAPGACPRAGLGFQLGESFRRDWVFPMVRSPGRLEIGISMDMFRGIGDPSRLVHVPHGGGAGGPVHHPRRVLPDGERGVGPDARVLARDVERGEERGGGMQSAAALSVSAGSICHLRLVQLRDGVQRRLRLRDPFGGVRVAEGRVADRRAEQLEVAVAHHLDVRREGGKVDRGRGARGEDELELREIEPQPDARRRVLQVAQRRGDGAVVAGHAPVVEVTEHK
eukprot:gene9087-biopygen12315